MTQAETELRRLDPDQTVIFISDPIRGDLVIVPPETNEGIDVLTVNEFLNTKDLYAYEPNGLRITTLIRATPTTPQPLKP